MPIFTTSISNQNQATQGGAYQYPSLSQVRMNTINSDSFTRLTLNPTNQLALYATAADGAGTIGINGPGSMYLTTGAVSGNQAQARTDQFSFTRTKNYIDNRSQITLDIIFALSQNTLQQGFIGLMSQVSSLSAIPTTQVHMGLEWDTTGTGNWILTSAGSVQTTVDTGVPIDTNLHRLTIIWNSNSGGTIALYGNTANSLSSTQIGTTKTVSSLFGGPTYVLAYLELFWYLNTQTTAARNLSCYEWQLQAL